MVARTWLGVAVTVALAALARTDAADPGLCITTVCMANGATECDRARTKCPSCMYTIPGGFSCYDKINGECPYPDVLVTCSTNQSPPLMRTPSPAPSAAAAASASTSIDRPATVKPPRIDTPPAPTTVVSSATAPPTMTTAPPRTSAVPSPKPADPAVPETQGSNPTSMQNKPTSTSAESAGTRTGPTDGRSAVPSSAPASLTPAPSPSTEKTSVLDASSTVSADSQTLSSMYVHIGVIVAAVGGVALVALFITRRMRERRDRAFLSTPEEDKDFSLQVDPRSGPSSRVFGTLGRSVSVGTAREGQRAHPTALRSARTRSASDIPSLMSMDSLTSSTVEFIGQHHPYGLPSQFGVPSDATFANSSSSSSSSDSSSFSASNVSVSSAALGFSQVPGPAHGQRPQQIDEDSDYMFYSNRKQSVGASVQTPLHRTASARPVHQPVYHDRIRRTSSATGNTYEDEYDIVHPHALRDGDRRNTETLVQDGHFQSNFSEHDVQAMKATLNKHLHSSRSRSSSDAVDDDDDRFFASKEHEI